MNEQDGEYERTDIYADAAQGRNWNAEKVIKGVNGWDEKNDRGRYCRYRY